MTSPYQYICERGFVLMCPGKRRKEVGEKKAAPANLNQLQFDDKDTASEEFLFAHLEVYEP
jgi:hypothetical protein